VVRTWLGRLGQVDDGRGTPLGIDVAVGAVAVTVGMFVAASFPGADPRWRCAIVATALGLFAAYTANRAAVALIIPATWMVMDGFLVNRLGELSWDGWPDLARFLVLVAAGCFGLAVGPTGPARAFRPLKAIGTVEPIGAVEPVSLVGSVSRGISPQEPRCPEDLVTKVPTPVTGRGAQ
jgi:hypothetical protein